MSAPRRLSTSAARSVNWSGATSAVMSSAPARCGWFVRVLTLRSSASNRRAMNRPVKLYAPVTTSKSRCSISPSKRKACQVGGRRTGPDVPADDDTRAVAHGLSGMDLGTHTVEDRKSQGPVRRPLRITDAHHQLRPDPVDWPDHDRGRVEGRILRRELDQPVAKRGGRFVVVAAADGAAWQETAVFVVTHHERIERFATRPVTQPAYDDEVVGLDCLDLQPEGASLSRHVGALPVLRDHALKAAFEARLEELDPVLFYVIGDKEMPARFD